MWMGYDVSIDPPYVKALVTSLVSTVQMVIDTPTIHTEVKSTAATTTVTAVRATRPGSQRMCALARATANTTAPWSTRDTLRTEKSDATTWRSVPRGRINTVSNEPSLTI